MVPRKGCQKILCRIQFNQSERGVEFVRTMSSLQGTGNTSQRTEEAVDILSDHMMIASHSKDAQIPSEPITRCGATLLMIQAFLGNAQKGGFQQLIFPRYCNQLLQV